MTGSLSALVPFGALVAFVYYVLARAEITRWFWQGVLQAPPRVKPPAGARFTCYRCGQPTAMPPCFSRAEDRYTFSHCINCPPPQPVPLTPTRPLDPVFDLTDAYDLDNRTPMTSEEIAQLHREIAARPPLPVSALYLTSRLRAFFDRLLSCPMCSGFWLGLACGWAFDLPAPMIRFQWVWGGVYGLVLCPILIGAMRWVQHQEHREACTAAEVERWRNLDAALTPTASYDGDNVDPGFGRSVVDGRVVDPDPPEGAR